jgi:hypothetical protein
MAGCLKVGNDPLVASNEYKNQVASIGEKKIIWLDA